MTRKHGISWLNMPGYIGKSWNPVVGCEIVSPGCTNCYAMKMAHRICAMQPDSHYQGTVKTVNAKPVWTGNIAAAPEHILTAPLHWDQRPRMVFVNSMGDLFHEGVETGLIDQVFGIISRSRCWPKSGGPVYNIFVILTKRPERMRDYIRTHDAFGRTWPLPNLWLGVSAENQAEADARIPILLDTPAAKRIVSVEPMLGEIEMRFPPILTRPKTPREYEKMSEIEKDEAANRAARAHYIARTLTPDWVICGGESGPDRRKFDPRWAEDLRGQCDGATVPFFFKQSGHRKAGDDLLNGVKYHNWPEVHDPSRLPAGAPQDEDGGKNGRF